MSSLPMAQLLEKINSKDKDFRYMATSDLLTELQKDTFRVDSDTEKKLCAAVLAQIDDLSGDISSLAVRCLGLLVRKVNEARAEDMTSQLCDKATSVSTKKEQQRDVASIGLKTVIGEIRGLPVANQLSQTITKKMLLGMTQENVDVVSDSIDVLSEVVDKCGSCIGHEHSRVRDALLPFLDDARAPVRKRALHCLAGICLYLNDDLLGGCVKAVVERLQAPKVKPDFARTYAQALGNISRVVGYRFGRHLAVVVPLIIQHCNKAGDSDDELKEHCLQALESFVSNVPTESKAHLEAILKVALSHLKHDPNYAAEDDDEDGNGMEEDDGEQDEEDEGEDEGYSDDEDVSWKVRRAAVKVLTALLLAYPEALPQLYAASAQELAGRFKEREESVRGDIFTAFVTLARQVGSTAYRYEATDTNSPMARLAANVPDVAKVVARQLKERNVKARVGGFQLLRELAAVVPAAVASQLSLLLPGIVAALTDKSSAASGLKIEALMFTRLVLASGPQGASADLASLKQLATAVLPCVNDRYYKLSAEAIRVLEQLVVVVRPAPASGAAPANLSALPMPAIFSALQAKLLTPDQDQEVKDAAISASAAVVARCGDLLGTELPVVLRTLLERLRNEITRLAAVRAFNVVAASPLPLDLAGPGVLEPVTAELTSFLRKALRPLRLSSLLALEAVVAKYGQSLPSALLASVTEEAAGLIADTDLALAAQGLRTLAVLLRVQPEAAQFAASKALPAALLLVRSPLLQGAALDQLNAFLTALAAAKLPGAGVDELLAALLQTGRSAGAGARSAQLAAAQCVAVLASSAGTQKVADTAQSLLGSMGGKDPSGQRLNLLCLGELGRRADLSQLPQVEAAVRAALQSDSEDVKGAASLALGGISCGNLTQYMPSLLRQIKEAPDAKQQYLLLTALNEVLTTISAPTTLHPAPSSAQPAGTTGRAAAAVAAAVTVPAPQPQLSEADQASALQLLLGSADSAQEECRMVIAECLGRLALLFPQQVLGQLQGRLADASQSMRSVVVSSLKYMVTERPHPIDAPLAAAAVPFLQLISDTSHHVRRSAVVSLTAIVHQKPSLVAASRDGAPPSLVPLLPALYDNTKIRTDLIRVVDLGPFKHQIDDGLELRKATFECLDILLDTPSCVNLLDVTTFLKHLQSGLGDHVDIKAPCHLMLAKIAVAAPTPVLASAEQLVAPLEATLTTRLKGDPVKQEVDRHEDMLRGCLRAVHAIAQLPGVEACTPFQAFMRRVVLVAPIKDKYNVVVKEQLDADAMDTA